MTYAGIGARKTPPEILKEFEQIGEDLAREGYTLRSGHAEGADSAFEVGCDKVNGQKEIYIPWKNFNGSKSDLIIEWNWNLNSQKAYDIAREFHPYYENLKPFVRKLMARNSFQVLGNLKGDKPSDFVICYTEGGELKGGTAQAIRIANAYGIPVYNFGSEIGRQSFYSDRENGMLGKKTEEEYSL